MEPITPMLTNIFNGILDLSQIPEDWANSTIIFLYKIGDQLNINNYRPISLLQTSYKVFTSILLNRLKPKLDYMQPREHAAFRFKFSTIDYIFVLTQIMETYEEYNKTLYIAFIDYSKASDSIYHDLLWLASKSHGIHNQYIRIPKEI
ncbi:unnamed protein product [Parnassius apollo]|uniref:(apollo) hypothetical protein n=1 Tax=Parnassius apollo TaxID=110799 RepID=A0A8S3WD06_PARAO|nr:unnamed protein product [Parnassius apollo]